MMYGHSRNSLPAPGQHDGFAVPGGATFSPSGRYRYALWRRWDSDRPLVLFVGLNPSTAGALRNDPTIRRCIGFASDWGYGGLLVGNLFAYCSTDPGALLAASLPVGTENDRWLETLVGTAAMTIVCWGVHGRHLGRDQQFLAQYGGLRCLGCNRGGSPTHPLYLPRSRRPVPFENAPPRQG